MMSCLLLLPPFVVFFSFGGIVAQILIKENFKKQIKTIVFVLSATHELLLKLASSVCLFHFHLIRSRLAQGRRGIGIPGLRQSCS